METQGSRIGVVFNGSPLFTGDSGSGESEIRKWVIENESSTLPMNELIEKYYNDCFVFVKPHERGGVTTMYDLAHMGRKTIGKGETNLPNFREYSDIKNLLDLIMEESKFIGQVRNDVATSLNDHFIGDEWLNLNYWK